MRFRTLFLPATLACVLLSGTAHAGPCDAHFTFDGNLNDASGNGYDGRLIGKGGGAAEGVASYGEGRNGQALLLSGSYAVRAPVDLSKAVCPQVTVALWVKLDDDPTKGIQDIFSSGRGGPRFDRAGTHLEVRSGNQRQLVKNGLRGGRWEFIAMVVDQEAGKMTVYWRQRPPFERDMKPVGTDSADIWIGALDDDLRNPVLAGAIDDVRIYGQLLTADQIKQIQVGTPRRPGSTQNPGDQAAVVNHEEQYSAPGIGDGTAEAGALPELFGDPDLPPDIGDGTGDAGAMPELFGDPDLPPDIGDGTGEAGVLPKLFGDPDLPPDIGDGRVVADAEQRVMSDQTGSLPGSGNLDGSNDGPTSLMPGGSRGTDLSGNDALQQAVEENAGPDITYGSEEEGEAAAAAAEERRRQESVSGESDAASNSSSPVAGWKNYKPVGEPSYGDMSGYSGANRDELELRLLFIDSISWDEVSNRPCDITIETSQIPSSNLTSKRYRSCTGSSSVLGSMGARSVSGIGAIRSLRVCNSGSRNRRLKGVQIWGADVDIDGERVDRPNARSEYSANCERWGNISRCPSGQLATGLFVHTNNASGDGEQIVGLQIICRRTELR